MAKERDDQAWGQGHRGVEPEGEPSHGAQVLPWRGVLGGWSVILDRELPEDPAQEQHHS